LILYDGAQEVARAVHGVTIQPAPPPRLRIVGTIIGLNRSTADSLTAGQNGIVLLGPVRPDLRRLRVGAGEIDLPIEGAWARDAVIRAGCDPDPNAGECSVGGRTLSAMPPPAVMKVRAEAKSPMRRLRSRTRQRQTEHRPHCVCS